LNNQFFPNHHLSGEEWQLIPGAFYQLLIARLKVSSLPSEKYLPVDQPPKATLTKENQAIAQTIATVINGLSRRTPWPSTCLVKVIAAHKMLSKISIPHTLHFGVQKVTPGKIKAHAWLSVGNKILIGGDNADGFVEISKIAS
jgi:hypothetical protein